jgi:hypothetical protein
MPEISEEELKAFQESAEKAKALEANKERILSEADKFKKRAQDAEGKLTEAEKKKLEEDGKINELLAKEREERQKLEGILKERTSSVLKEKVRAEVGKVAKDAFDVDMVLRVNEHKSLLKIDEDALSVAGVEEFVSKVRETHNFLFGKKKMPVDGDGKPPAPKDGEEGFKSDEEKFRQELSNVQTRKEQVAVYKKYGKTIDNYNGY